MNIRVHIPYCAVERIDSFENLLLIHSVFRCYKSEFDADSGLMNLHMILAPKHFTIQHSAVSGLVFI